MHTTHGINRPKDLAARYLALRNEPDADRRRETVAALWTQDGRHLLQPPQEVRTLAAQPGIGLTAVLEARGHVEITARAASAFAHWVGGEGLRFRGRDDAERLGDVVAFHWEAVGADDAVAAAGLNVLILAGDGRIARDHVFVARSGRVR